MSDCHTVHHRRARKHYRCEACYLGIRPGDVYADCTGIFDGGPYRDRRHVGCAAAIVAARADYRDPYEGPYDLDTCLDCDAITDDVLAAVATERWAVRVRWLLARQAQDDEEPLAGWPGRAARRHEVVEHLHARDSRARDTAG